MSKILNSPTDGGNLKCGKGQKEEILIDILFKQLAEIEYMRFLEVKGETEKHQNVKIMKNAA